MAPCKPNNVYVTAATRRDIVAGARKQMFLGNLSAEDVTPPPPGWTFVEGTRESPPGWRAPDGMFFSSVNQTNYPWLTYRPRGSVSAVRTLTVRAAEADAKLAKEGAQQTQKEVFRLEVKREAAQQQSEAQPENPVVQENVIKLDHELARAKFAAERARQKAAARAARAVKINTAQAMAPRGWRYVDLLPAEMLGSFGSEPLPSDTAYWVSPEGSVFRGDYTITPWVDYRTPSPTVDPTPTETKTMEKIVDESRRQADQIAPTPKEDLLIDGRGRPDVQVTPMTPPSVKKTSWLANPLVLGAGAVAVKLLFFSGGGLFGLNGLGSSSRRKRRRTRR